MAILIEPTRREMELKVTVDMKEERKMQTDVETEMKIQKEMMRIRMQMKMKMKMRLHVQMEMLMQTKLMHCPGSRDSNSKQPTRQKVRKILTLTPKLQMLPVRLR